MQLQQRHIDALDRAETLMFHSDFCPYLELKELLAENTSQARSQFRYLFTDYYGMNTAGLTNDFKDRYFEILFGDDVFSNGEPNFQPILTTLSLIPNRKGFSTLQCSFVSKLVGMRRESSPIYDSHVSKFFGERVPSPSRSQESRILWFVDFLKRVAQDYTSWAHDERVCAILRRFKKCDERLAHCDTIRLMDFLVWNVGNRELL